MPSIGQTDTNAINRSDCRKCSCEQFVAPHRTTFSSREEKEMCFVLTSPKSFFYCPTLVLSVYPVQKTLFQGRLSFIQYIYQMKTLPTGICDSFLVLAFVKEKWASPRAAMREKDSVRKRQRNREKKGNDRILRVDLIALINQFLDFMNWNI